MFPSGSSSSLLNTCNDAEAFEVSSSSAKTRSSKDKEVLYHEIIDVDVEEDSECDDVTLTHVIQKTSRKDDVSQFDHMGGFEATLFPWFPRNNTKVPETRSSILSTSSKGSKRPAGVQINAGGKKGKISSQHKEYNVEGHKKIQASRDLLLSHASTERFSHPINKSTYRRVWSSNLDYYPYGAMSANNGGGDFLTLKVRPTTTFTPQKFPDDGVDWVKNQDCASASSKNVDEILQKYENFKKFDIVDDFPDHFYRTKDPAKHIGEAKGQMWARKIQEEWRILEKDLPDKIFVRVCESRMDLLRAVIIGAEGTPYHDGLYFFDVFFPSGYPISPPDVYYHSGVRNIHPNISYTGTVCMSLLTNGNGFGRPMENWISRFSTILQVLVSIQGLIFTAKPCFGINGHGPRGGYNVNCENKSAKYNENTFLASLNTMGRRIRRPPKHFEEFVAGHFCKYGGDILVSCKAYLHGAQVGCLVKGGGGVQDVNEGDTSCSKRFRALLPGFMRCLANAFSQLGATSGTGPDRNHSGRIPNMDRLF